MIYKFIKILLFIALTVSLPATAMAQADKSKKEKVQKKQKSKKAKKKIKKKNKKTKNKKKKVSKKKLKKKRVKKSSKKRYKKKVSKIKRLNSKKSVKKVKIKEKKKHEQWHYILGWGNEAFSVGLAHISYVSSGGFWRLEKSFHTVLGDATFGAEENAYSLNALLSMNIKLFNRLTVSVKGGPSLRHVGLGTSSTTEFYNYGASLDLDLDERGQYGLFFYADLVGFAFIHKF